MAFAHVANRGALSAKAAGASLDLVLGAGQGIGLDRLVLVWAAWDNSDNVNAATTRLSASDEVANTYTPVVEFTQGGGAAAAGVTAFLAAAVTSTAPAEGDFIRVTSNDAVRVAKVLSVAEFSKTAGSTIVVAAVDADGGTGGGAFAPALADLEEREYLFAGGFVFERGDHASLAFDQDDDYTDIGFGSTVGGAANANLSLFGGFRIATVTGDTWGVSVGAAAGECAHFLVAFYEEEEGGQTIAIAAAVETDTAQPLTAAKRKAIGPALDTSAAKQLGREKTVAISPAVETTTATALAYTRSRILGLAVETDAAQPVGKAKAAAIAAAAETDTAHALTAEKTRLLGAAGETDLAGELTVVVAGETLVAIDAAVELDTATVLGRGKRHDLSPAVETDEAQQLAREKTRALSPAAELDTARLLGSLKRQTIEAALETDTAAELGRLRILVLAPAFETDLAAPLAWTKRNAIAAALETDSAGLLTLPPTVAPNLPRASGRVVVVRADGTVAVVRAVAKTDVVRASGTIRAL